MGDRGVSRGRGGLPRLAGFSAFLLLAGCTSTGTSLSSGKGQEPDGGSSHAGPDCASDTAKPDGEPAPPDGGAHPDGNVDATSCVHPADAGRCSSSTRPPGTYEHDAAPLPDGSPRGPNYPCNGDRDCVYDGGTNGRCDTAQSVDEDGAAMPIDAGICTYDLCFSDEECEPGTLCECDPGSGNACVPGNCRSDTDCTCGPCTRSIDIDVCIPAFGTIYGGEFCRTPNDECTDDAECNPTNDPEGSRCAWNPIVAKWTCVDAMCAG